MRGTGGTETMSARGRAFGLLAIVGVTLAACSEPAIPGIAWTKVSDPQAMHSVSLMGAATAAGGFIAVGSKGSDGVVMRSSDGASWSALSAAALAS